MISWLTFILFFKVFMVSNYAHYYWLIYRGCNQPCQSSLTQFCFQGQYTLLKLIVPEPLFPYGRVSLSVIALEWLIQYFVVIPWILLGKSLGSLVGHSVLPNECTETATSRPPIALILSSVLRLVHNIFSTSELNVIIFITIADAIVVQVQKYSYLCYSWILPYRPAVGD